MMRVVLAIALMLAFAPSAPPRQNQADALLLTDVFVAGENGYHTYRIPSAIVTLKGTLLAFAEARKSGAGDAGDIDLVMRRSHDGGRSWTPMEVIGDNGPNTVGNPCPVVDPASNTIWLLTTQNRGTDREKDIIAGTSAGSRTVWVMRSNDDGGSWSSPVEITTSVKRPDWTWYATGPGIGIRTTGGLLVVPANHAEGNGGIHRSHLVLSHDGGRTWTLGASADPGTNESQVVELADGTLLLNMRNHPPKPENFRMVGRSRDGGRTLSPAVPDRALIEPPAQASMLRLTRTGAGDRNRLLFANPASTARERLTVRLSYDEGDTWPISRVIHAGPAAYSSLAVLPDRSIGGLFERGERSPYERISLARFTLEWLTSGADRMPATAPGR